MTRVKAKGIPVLACEPTMAEDEFLGSEVTHGLEGFRRRADVIVANRWSDELSHCSSVFGPIGQPTHCDGYFACNDA